MTIHLEYHPGSSWNRTAQGSRHLEIAAHPYQGRRQRLLQWSPCARIDNLSEVPALGHGAHQYSYKQTEAYHDLFLDELP
jgi:hypothetical protein